MLVESDRTFSENVYKTHTIVSFYNLEWKGGKKTKDNFNGKVKDGMRSKVGDPGAEIAGKRMP